MQKQCSTCLRLKPAKEFYRDKRKSDGLYSRCKACHGATVEKRAKTPEGRAEAVAKTLRYQASERGRAVTGAYKQSESYKESIRERSRAYYQRNPKKKYAHDKVYHAIKTGKLTRGVCEVCGSSDVHAHHDDYDRPLDVRWLCHEHHVEVHLEGRNG